MTIEGEASWSGSMPEVYDRVLVPALFAPFARLVAARAMAQGASRVLDLAAGTGVATAAIAAALPAATVTGTDLNRAMVDWSAGSFPRLTWQVADACHLPFADAAFDLVTCQFGAMFFADRPRAYREARRVLTTDGTFLFTVWDDVAASPFPAALVEAVHHVFPHDPPTFVERVPHGYHDVDLITAELVDAGFAAPTVETVVLEGSAPSAASLAEGFCVGTPLRFALAERGFLPDLTAELAERMTQRLGEGPVTGPLAALVVTARR